MKTLIIIVAILSYSIRDRLLAQDAVVYSRALYQGTPIPISIGQSIPDITLGGIDVQHWNKSVRIVNRCGVYLFTQPNFQGTFIFINSDLPYIEKIQVSPINSQYQYVRSIKCTTADDVPQPRRWIPVDGRDIPTGHPVGTCSQRPPLVTGSLLTIRRVFIWENTETYACPHGPWGELGIRALAGNGADGFKLAGPTSYAHDKCLLGCWPSDEWADNGDGMMYTNYGILDWGTTNQQSVEVTIEEGGVVFMRFTVNRSESGVVYFQNNYGFIEVQNVQRLQPEPRSCPADKFVCWTAISDGYPEGPHYPLQGNAHYPFDSLIQAVNETPTSGTLAFYAGAYSGSFLFTKKMTLIACGGVATIGNGQFHPPQTSVPALPNCDCPGLKLEP